MPPKRSRSSKKATSTPAAATKSSAGRSISLSLFIGGLVVAVAAAWLLNALPLSLTGATNNTSAFEVRALPGRGMGVIALRDIKQGELLIKEKPLLVVPLQISSAPGAYVLSRVRDLQPAQQAAFWNLSYVHLSEDPHTPPDEARALAIFQTNAVSAGDGAVGLFPTMARLNHACAGVFNAVYSYRESKDNGEQGEIRVYAIKDITEGAEVLTTYTDTKRPRAERSAYLREAYDFTCSCASCTLPTEASAASDARLVEMTALRARLGDWSAGALSGADAIDAVRRIWELGAEEGYVSERGRLAADAAHAAAAHSDAVALQAWAALAQEWYGIELGADSEYASEMGAVVREPRSHRAWGTRAQAEVGGPLTTRG